LRGRARKIRGDGGNIRRRILPWGARPALFARAPRRL